MTTLYEPRIAGCSFEEFFSSRMLTFCLKWPSRGGCDGSDTWNLPEGVCLQGPAERFGVIIQRTGEDRYAVRLVWNQTHFAWNALTRRQLEASCIATILASLGTQLQDMLDQPLESDQVHNPLHRLENHSTNGSAAK